MQIGYISKSPNEFIRGLGRVYAALVAQSSWQRQRHDVIRKMLGKGQKQIRSFHISRKGIRQNKQRHVMADILENRY